MPEQEAKEQTSNFSFIDYWDSLTPKDRRAYMDRAGISESFTRQHLRPEDPLVRKMPSVQTFRRLIRGSEGKIDVNGAINFFYKDKILAELHFED